MRTAYFDAFSGISGDMIVGALLDLGVPLKLLQEEFAKLPLRNYRIEQERCERSGIWGVKFHVHLTETEGDRNFDSISRMLQTSDLSENVRETALRVFKKLAEAEALVHRQKVAAVHFHEVGAVDSILDIVGVAVGVDYLQLDEFYTSTLPLGKGLVSARHGPLPIPGPATIELLKGFPVDLESGTSELVTPTGAAVVSALAKPGAPPLSISEVGYGAGSRELADRPNMLRICVGSPPFKGKSEHLVMLNTNIDDFNPEWYDYVMEALFVAGAKDVFLSSVQMKKNRPGIQLSVLCKPGDQGVLSEIIFNETSTLGLRAYSVDRLMLEREVVEVRTPYGLVKVKVAYQPDGRKRYAPEYDDCKRCARESHVPVKIVYDAAVACLRTGRM